MKRLTLLLTIFLMSTTSMMAERVTPETARKVAATFLNNNGAKSDQLTDLSKEAGFDNLYIFNAEQSFVIIAADDCVKPILGYSLTGRFVAEDMPSNVNGWLKGYNDEIQNAIDSKIKATAETTKLWKDLAIGDSKAAKTTVVVGPLIQTKWDQNKYYNNLCPSVSDGPEGRAYTGCVATAMAQIMKYWEYPTHGIGSHSYTWNSQTLSANYGDTYYDWKNMANYYTSYYANGTDTYGISVSNTNTEITAVATLMFHCGVALDMNYGGNSTGGSSAITARVAEVLQSYFNYSSDIKYKSKSDYDDDVWIEMVKNELDGNRPLQYRGRSDGGGHSFVCDGYDDADYFHFNWGWSGAYDGYFSLSNLDTGANNQSGQGNGIYTNSQGAIFGIHPAQCAASDPTDLTYTLIGLQDLTLSWTPANGAVSYNIYRNNLLIASSNNTSYTEIAPSGNNVYYVRSVDANGIMSLSSNTIIVTIEYQTPKVEDLRASYSGNTVSLTWSTPEWCYPETPSSTLTYGTQSNSDAYYSFGTNRIYWGHRHLAEDLSIHQGQRLYSIDFYAFNIGGYELCIYEGTTTNTTTNNEVYTVPLGLVYSQPITVATSGWVTIDLAQPYYINNNQDLWIFIHNTEAFDDLQSYLCSAEGDYGVYYSSEPLSYTHNNASGYAFLIKAFLTNGAYTYNLYQDGVSVAINLSDTTYSNVSLNNNATNLFTVKTNYYGGETSNSNMIGFAKGTVSLSSLELGTNDMMTVTESSNLTVSGSLICNSPDHLVLENGAQLINDSENVQATVKESITGHEATDLSGWKFIASPISTAINPIDAGLITDTYGNSIPDGQSASYDLYYFDESQELPWKNYRKESFSLENGKGYLYANNNNRNLAFAGTLYNGNGQVTLAYNDGPFKGWNLVGNPFTCDATINRPSFIINGRNLKASTGLIPPCTGAMVQAAAIDTTLNTIDYDQIDRNVTFTKVNPSSATPLPNQLQITMAQQAVNRDGNSTDSEIVDNAIVSFNKGNLLEKFVFNADLAKLYIPQNGKDFAIVTSEGIGEMPVNFSAAKDGTYTLTVNPEGVEMNYLHLIDNTTGADVDLLTNPSYTFEAKTSDYESRFKLVFASGSVFEGEDGNNDNFAFFSNGQWIINNNGESNMQVLDVTGRILRSERFSGGCDIQINYAPGVYVLRLINGEKVRIQKIIID